MGSALEKAPTPIISNVKDLRTLQDLPLCTIPQIMEVYHFWQNSSYAGQLTLGKQGFEEIFGSLFPDPELHFPIFLRTNVQVCVTLEVFTLIVLFCDATLQQKVKCVCDIYPDTRNSIRMDSLQTVIFRVLTAMPLLFNVLPPIRDEVFRFIDESLHSYQERIMVAMDTEEMFIADTLRKASTASGERNNIGQFSLIKSIKSQQEKEKLLDENRIFSFNDLWQWCQDVNQVSAYLDAIERICFQITSKMDRSRKGPQGILRQSFFTNHANNTRSSLIFKVAEVANQIGLARFSTARRHPLWNYSFKQLASEVWIEDLPTMTADMKVFSVLEHLILSRNMCLPLFKKTFPREKDRNQDKERNELIGIVDHRTLVAWLVESAPPRTFRAMKKLEELEETKKKSEKRNAYELLDEMFQQELADELMKEVGKLDVNEGKQDKANSVDDADKSSNEPVEGQEQKDQDENGVENEEIKNSDREDDAEIQSDDEEYENNRDGNSKSDADVNRGKLLRRNISRVQERVKLWNSYGETIANSNIERIVAGKYDTSHSHVYTINQYLYNAILMIAEGHLYVPISYAAQTADRLMHVIFPFEIVSLLSGRYAEFFPEIARKSIYWSGVMSKPLLVEKTVNLGSAWYQMLKRNLESCVILDENKKVGGMLYMKSIENLWWHWKKNILIAQQQQAAQQQQQQQQSVPQKRRSSVTVGVGSSLSSDNKGLKGLPTPAQSTSTTPGTTAVCFNDLLNDYQTNKYTVYTHDTNRDSISQQQSLAAYTYQRLLNINSANSEQNALNFSYFQILQNSLENCKEIDINIMNFDDFMKRNDWEVMLHRFNLNFASDKSQEVKIAELEKLQENSSLAGESSSIVIESSLVSESLAKSEDVGAAVER